MCHVCGGKMADKIMDLPFNLTDTSIAVVRQIPVSACIQCGEVVLQDLVVRELETLLDAIDPREELRVVRFAA